MFWVTIAQFWKGQAHVEPSVMSSFNKTQEDTQIIDD